MTEEWEKQDRQRPPCPDCGTLLYEKFWGNGGWAPTEQSTGKTHGPEDCVVMLKAQLAGARVAAIRECIAVCEAADGASTWLLVVELRALLEEGK